MKIEKTTITPKMAEKLLKYNVGNRSMRRQNVIYWERAILNDEVKLTHQGIAVQGNKTRPERLIDGQHRLQAIVNTQKPMEAMLATGVSPEAFAVLDSGVSRTMADRSALNKGEILFANFVFRVFRGRSTGRIQVGDAEDMVNVVSESLEACKVRCNKRGLTKQCINAAFILHHHKTGESLFQEFANGEFDRLTPRLNALYRKVACGQLLSHSPMERMISFIETYRALIDPDNKRRFKKVENPTAETRGIIEYTCPEITKVAISRNF
jgi:hypothetical protein